MSRPERSPAPRSAHRRPLAVGWRAIVALVLGTLVLSACRVDAEVEIAVDRTGAGTISVTVSADAEVLAAQPDLITDFRGADLEAAGWTLDGPTATAEGGARVVIRHPFDSIAEANALLAQLSGTNGPFQRVELAQDRSPTRVATSLSGTILVAGTGAFVDTELLTALSSAPYDDVLRQRGLTLDQALGVRFVATVPGEVVETDGTADAPSGDEATSRVRWTAALAGVAVAPPGQPMTLRAVFDDDGARQAEQVRDFTPWALGAWIVFFLLVVLPVVYLRRRRARTLPGRR